MKRKVFCPYLPQEQAHPPLLYVHWHNPMCTHRRHPDLLKQHTRQFTHMMYTSWAGSLENRKTRKLKRQSWSAAGWSSESTRLRSAATSTHVPVCVWCVPVCVCEPNEHQPEFLGSYASLLLLPPLRKTPPPLSGRELREQEVRAFPHSHMIFPTLSLNPACLPMTVAPVTQKMETVMNYLTLKQHQSFNLFQLLWVFVAFFGLFDSKSAYLCVYRQLIELWSQSHSVKKDSVRWRNKVPVWRASEK